MRFLRALLSTCGLFAAFAIPDTVRWYADSHGIDREVMWRFLLPLPIVVVVSLALLHVAHERWKNCQLLPLQQQK